MEVSLVFLDDRAMRAVNKKWHKYDRQTNVLAFLLDALTGEIVINPYEAEREAKRVGESYTRRVAYLFSHGLLHLYGHDHKTEKDGKKMEKEEQNILNHIYGV